MDYYKVHEYYDEKVIRNRILEDLELIKYMSIDKPKNKIHIVLCILAFISNTLFCISDANLKPWFLGITILCMSFTILNVYIYKKKQEKLMDIQAHLLYSVDIAKAASNINYFKTLKAIIEAEDE